MIDFGPVRDTTKDIIKVVGVGGGGCNAVANMFLDGMESVRFAVCNTDSKSLSKNPVPTKIMLGKSGLGAGADPEKGRKEAESNIDEIRALFDDNTKMVFVTAAMGGGTGTGAGPLVAKVSREMGMLTIGIVTIPFYFERRPKIIKALKGLDEMRSNVDALLIINNEQISKVYSDSHISVREALKLADNVMGNAVRSISELITLAGEIQVDFADVKTTMTNGGGAIMAIGRASGEHRVRNAVLDALNSPLLYGADISKATRILLNIYTSSDHELYVDELAEIDAFMDELDSNIEVIWGMAKDDTLDEDAKITILATGFDNSIPVETKKAETTEDYNELIDKLYGRNNNVETASIADPPFTIVVPNAPEIWKENTVVDNDNGFTKVGNDMDQDEEQTITEEFSGSSEAKKPEPKYEDPAKSFLNRVKARIISGLSELTKPEE
ncbi:MAG: cell division protein FtsZ [Prevotella sp.]|nr:cell division protein FtsZ [Candidatus Prevotella equi]